MGDGTAASEQGMPPAQVARVASSMTASSVAVGSVVAASTQQVVSSGLGLPSQAHHIWYVTTLALVPELNTLFHGTHFTHASALCDGP